MHAMLKDIFIIVIAIVLYWKGFFPVQAPPETSRYGLREDNYNLSTKFQKAVLIVIDALRLDFVNPSLMPFLANPHRNEGCFIQVKVETPTVTLPRIKALVSGSVPQFLDVIFNLAKMETLQDSVIHSAFQRGKRMVFYGDDTWLKLFPNYFVRSEGTSSFFVNDFKEVDDNVTRNVLQELKRSDWDIMILHYLGLDHIGHVQGPRSHLIPDKLKEMDDIIEKIYRSLTKNDEQVLMMITSDHGMKDSGGHGGSTFAECNVPLIVLGMPCSNDSFFQTDVTPNLALLLGLNIPSTNIGQIRSSMFSNFTIIDYLNALKYNTKLLITKTEVCTDDFNMANYFYDMYLLSNQTKFANDAAKLYENCAKVSSEKLLTSASTQNDSSLIISILVILTSLLKIVQCVVQNDSKFNHLEVIALFLILVLQFLECVSQLLVLFVVLILVKTLLNTSITTFKNTFRNKCSFLIIMSIIHPLSFASSSFIEEEHQFWYFFCSSFIAINLTCQLSLKSLHSVLPWVFILIGIRLVKMINQVGDQWAALPDFSDWLTAGENRVFYLIFFICSLIITGYSLKILQQKNKMNIILDCSFLLLVNFFKLVEVESILLGKVLWLLIFMKILLCFLKITTVESVWILITLLLLKPYNVILIPACCFTSLYFHKVFRNHIDIILAHLWMGTLLFFAQGHCNSLASVDISAGYVGLSHYDPIFVVPQVLCHTYAFPVLSHMLLLKKFRGNKCEIALIFIVFRLYTILIVFFITFIQRSHLFIWSVFTPKMFVESSHVCFQFLEILCYVLCNFISTNCKMKRVD